MAQTYGHLPPLCCWELPWHGFLRNLYSAVSLPCTDVSPVIRESMSCLLQGHPQIRAGLLSGIELYITTHVEEVSISSPMSLHYNYLTTKVGSGYPWLLAEDNDRHKKKRNPHCCQLSKAAKLTYNVSTHSYTVNYNLAHEIADK